MRKIKKIGDVETLPVDFVIHPPIKENVKLLSSHIGRYVVANRKLNIRKTDIVVDASCGEGYGTYYLSTLCNRAYGLDIYEKNLEYAQKHFNTDNLKFYKYFDFLKKRTIAHKLVCIETLEHVDKEKMMSFVKLLLRILRVGGDMFLTVPIGKNVPSHYNPFHKNEPSIDIIYTTFMPYFKKMDIEINSFVNSYGYETNYALITLFSKKGVKK